jgi:hypothetical protein
MEFWLHLDYSFDDLLDDSILVLGVRASDDLKRLLCVFIHFDLKI